MRAALPNLLLVSVLACVPSCKPARQGAASPAPPPEARLARYAGRSLGGADAPVRVVAFLPVNNGCQDAIGEYLALVAENFPDLYQIRILDMKDPAAKAEMRANRIQCAAVMVNGTTTFALGGEDGTFILEGPMDPRDVVRALRAAGALARDGQAPSLPSPPELPGIENMCKRAP